MGSNILSLSAYDVIAHFNDGTIVSAEILKDMNSEPGDHMMKGLQIQSEFCKIHAAYRMSKPQLKRRKIIRIKYRLVNAYFTKYIFCFV